MLGLRKAKGGVGCYEHHLVGYFGSIQWPRARALEIIEDNRRELSGILVGVTHSYVHLTFHLRWYSVDCEIPVKCSDVLPLYHIVLNKCVGRRRRKWILVLNLPSEPLNTCTRSPENMVKIGSVVTRYSWPKSEVDRRVYLSRCIFSALHVYGTCSQCCVGGKFAGPVLLVHVISVNKKIWCQ